LAELLLSAGVDDDEDEHVVEMLLQVNVADVVLVVPDPPLPLPLQIRGPAVLGRRSRFLKLSENEPMLTSYLVPFTAATGTS
jgi:hypothetical protein